MEAAGCVIEVAKGSENELGGGDAYVFAARLEKGRKECVQGNLVRFDTSTTYLQG